LEKASKDKDEIISLTHTISAITTEMKQKEQTWVGDLERRNQAVQKLSRTLQEQAASFETALNAVELPVCLFGANGNIVQVNQKFSQFVKAPLETMKKKSLLEVASELAKLVADPGGFMK